MMNMRWSDAFSSGPERVKGNDGLRTFTAEALPWEEQPRKSEELGFEGQENPRRRCNEVSGGRSLQERIAEHTQAFLGMDDYLPRMT